MVTYSRDHELKCHPQYFERVRSGQKRFEIRKNDRDFQVGDWVKLKCWNPETDEYTGSAVALKIIYVTTYGQPEGWCVFGFTIGEEK